jgi:hemoglobin
MNQKAPVRPLSVIDEAAIHRLVRAFYAGVRADAEPGPIFEAAIGDRWDAHLDRMTDFWSSVLLTSGRYSGNPMIKHLRQKAIRPPHFTQWLVLFDHTARELFTQDCAESFIAKAHNIARSLQLGMYFRPDAARPNHGRAAAG